MTAQLDANNQVVECVTNIHLLPDGRMRFEFTWTANLQAGAQVDIVSAVGNTNMYLMDDMGNRYDALQVEGDAARTTRLINGQTAHGWFLFPELAPGANSLTFHDDDYSIQSG